MKFQLGYRFTGKHHHQLQGQNSQLWFDNFSESSVAEIDLSASWYFGRDENYQLTLWGKNLTDEQYCNERSSIPGTNTESIRLCNSAEPATYGLSFVSVFD